MAIHHLLFACVECGREAAIRRAAGGAEQCIHCGTKYSRADGANIRVEPPGRPAEIRHPSAWLDLITQRQAGDQTVPASEQAIVRFAEQQKPYRHGGIYLGHVERFGPRIAGTLSLDAEALHFEHAGGREQWPLSELTAVQPSSKSLQLRLRNGVLLGLEFPEGSPLLWEDRVRDAVQRLYTESGRGAITEYQPRIVCG